MSLAVSGLVLTQNSESTIQRCLDSLQELNQVIVVDGGSHDRTEEICRSYPNVSFFHNPWPGFIAQREFSRQKATNAWCLMLDSDEALTREAFEECRKAVVALNPLPMYAIVRTEYFNGTPIESGHGKSDYQERLFLKDRVQYYGGTHHLHMIDGVEAARVPEKIGYFKREARILHEPQYGVYEWILKVPRFTLTLAEEKQHKKKVGPFELAFCFIGYFLKVYLKTFREGKVGLILSLQTAVVRTLIKLRIYELQNFPSATKDINKSNLG